MTASRPTNGAPAPANRPASARWRWGRTAHGGPPCHPAFHASTVGFYDLHVLLRHRLLRQVHGFEGFGMGVEKVRHQTTLPWAPAGGYVLQTVSSVGGVATRAGGRGRDCEGLATRHISKVAHFDNLDEEVGEGVEQVLPPAAR